MSKTLNNLKKTVDSKNIQLVGLKSILKSAISSYQELTKENKQLKQYITNIKQQQLQQQQQYKQQKIYTKPKRYKKVVYEEQTDSETEQEQKETPTFKEIEEQDNSLEQQQQ